MMNNMNNHWCERNERQANYDARGIFLCYTCDKCHAAKMARYRPDVLTDSNYWADEDIDGD
jgi:hypothetical protein